MDTLHSKGAHSPMENKNLTTPAYAEADSVPDNDSDIDYSMIRDYADQLNEVIEDNDVADHREDY